MVQAPYNASPKQQLAMAQLQQSQMQGGALQTGEQNYYVTFLPGDKIVTNAYPQLYKMTGWAFESCLFGDIVLNFNLFVINFVFLEFDFFLLIPQFQ